MKTMQRNLATKVEYKGKNQDVLTEVKKVKKYSSNFWATFIQAKVLGLKVIKGSKGVALSKVVTQTKQDKTGKEKKVSKLVHFVVFNKDQFEKVEIATK